MEWIKELKFDTEIGNMSKEEKLHVIFKNFMKKIGQYDDHVIVQTDGMFFMVEESYFQDNSFDLTVGLKSASKIIVDQYSGEIIKNKIDETKNLLKE